MLRGYPENHRKPLENVMFSQDPPWWPILRLTENLTVIGKPSKTVGYSDISAFGASWEILRLNGCYLGASTESAGPP